jgi:hypothetical protein
MDPAVSIRRADSADADTVLALWRAEDVSPSLTDDREGLRRLLAAPPAMVRYVCDAGQRRTASTP